MSEVFSEHIFSGHFPFQGPHLVAASAGTGKTYSIQNIYARLVAEKGLSPSEIVVVTFTEPATNELRERIRTVLKDFKKFIVYGKEAVKESEIERFESLVGCIIENAPREESNKSLSKALKNIDSALDRFDSASISTIHGFCKRALSKFALETGSPFDFEVSGAEDTELHQSVMDWWRLNSKSLYARNDFDASFDAKSFLYEAVKKLSDREYCKLDFPNSGDTTQDYILKEAQNLVARHVEKRDTREKLTFQDLLVKLGKALAGPQGKKLAKDFRKDCKAALIDEFQDTDPVQYDIFKRIFLDVDETEEKPALFLVGDPKQAIYSFRGGDIFTYRAAAARKDIADATYRLEKNFRSTPRLIDAVNLLFRDDPESPGSTFGDKTIDYTDNLESEESREPLLENGQPDPKPMKFIETAKAPNMINAAVDEIIKLLSRPEHDIKPGDIAVLARNSPGKEIRQLLESRGVSTCLEKAGSVFADPLAKDLLFVLKAIAEDCGVKEVRASLCSKLFDIDVGKLADPNEDGILCAMRKEFAVLAEIWRRQGFEAMFLALERLDRCRLKERFAQSRKSRNDLQNITKIYELACSAIHAIGREPEALVAWLETRIRLSDENQPEENKKEYAKIVDSKSNAVKIMTHHVSKGLQFPITIVIIPAKSGGQDNLFAYHDDEGSLNYTYSRNDKSKKEIDDEAMRILYVSLTRATKRTIVIYSKSNSSPVSIQRLLERAKNRLKESGDASPIAFPEEFGAKSEEESPEETTLPKPPGETILGIAAPACPRIDFTTNRPAYGSYSSLVQTTVQNNDGDDFDNNSPLPESEDMPQDSAHPIFDLPGGAKTGTCWHEILEKIRFDASKEDIRTLAETTLKIHGFNPFDKEKNVNVLAAVSDMIEATLKKPLTSPDGKSFSLSEVREDERTSEWEFNFSLANANESTLAIRDALTRHWANDIRKKPFLDSMQGWDRPIPQDYMKGYLDLVFSHNGYYYIVDWKSNSLEREKENFSAEGILQEMANAGYFLQYILYSAVLHRFLKDTLGEKYSWQKNFGGVKYVFLRGVACDATSPIFEDRPSEELLDELCEVLGLGENSQS